ncbi:1-aminocyclopropane-1-carboxylate deaminase/D-cysteine desulfhydrase [Nocardia amikacinitolerans]|uniref:1-aminocyclopropane-1-carboxylate deaminase/D-cysteine desulfhydrase n=1 Tax=Nocardia amikacinitolerans TaxID=756689 RepID=UPI0020A52F41|nr:pyridoxal-phosphate dependent enzyme [Nocardia amikacinitolerans]MCP2280407.1 D-cysteine desulfhydrase [Nocardia amikacinitolerans]
MELDDRPALPLLHARLPEVADDLPFRRLGTAPTPVRPLHELPTGVAPVWLKDESRYGDGGWGGNKVRKLEWLLPEAVRTGRRTLLTVGGVGTNWGLAAALYGRELGLHTVLALIDQPIDEHVRAQLARLEASGAEIHRTRTKSRTVLTAPLLYAKHWRPGAAPFYLPAGGSAPLGVLGYVEAGLEIAAQVRAGVLPEPSHVVTAIGSGGTAAGLVLGLRLAGLRTRVFGVVVNDTLRLDAPTLLRLADRTIALLRKRGAVFEAPALTTDDLEITRNWLGPGYGHPIPAATEAADLAGDSEGLALEPVYTAKALAALLSHNAQGSFGTGPVLFLNTNGPR